MSESAVVVPWRWTSVALVLLVLTASWATTVATMPPGWTRSAAVTAAGLVAYPGLLAGFLLLWILGRMSDLRLSPWLAVGLSITATHGLMLTLAYWGDAYLRPRTSWTLLSDAVLAALLVALSMLVRFRVDPVDAGAASLAAGFFVVAVHLRAGQHQIDLGSGFRVLAVCLVAVAAGLLASRLLAISRTTRVPPQAARALAAGAVTLLTGLAVTDAVSSTGVLWSGVLVVSALVGAALMCGTFLELVRQEIDRTQVWGRVTDRELGILREDLRGRREQLHEVRATIAGIVSALEVLDDDRVPTAEGRSTLTEMLRAETTRLHRLLEAQVGRSEPFDLDEAIRPVILARRAGGQVIDWTPSGHTVHGVCDDVAQVVSILLDNAAVHAPGARVRISTRVEGPWLELVVADDGPGIPPAVAERIFEWGVRGRRSPGSGIGLHVARRLMASSHGQLAVRSVPGETAFVVGLPLVETLADGRPG